MILGSIWTDAAFVAGVVALGLAVAIRGRRRGASDGPTPAPTRSVPERIDRAEFGAPPERWLVVVFASRTCESCSTVTTAAEVLRSDNVGVMTVYEDDPLQARYGITAVPITIVVDSLGSVVESFVGPVGATELWSAVAAIRADD